jgi:hypothetical protein
VHIPAGFLPKIDNDKLGREEHRAYEGVLMKKGPRNLSNLSNN